MLFDHKTVHIHQVRSACVPITAIFWLDTALWAESASLLVFLALLSQLFNVDIFLYLRQLAHHLQLFLIEGLTPFLIRITLHLGRFHPPLSRGCRVSCLNHLLYMFFIFLDSFWFLNVLDILLHAHDALLTRLELTLILHGLMQLTL